MGRSTLNLEGSREFWGQPVDVGGPQGWDACQRQATLLWRELWSSRVRSVLPLLPEVPSPPCVGR